LPDADRSSLDLPDPSPLRLRDELALVDADLQRRPSPASQEGAPRAVVPWPHGPRTDEQQ
jgi:hypothetical protein